MQVRRPEVYDQALKENKSSINAKMWAYRGVTVKLNVFDFTVSRCFLYFGTAFDGPRMITCNSRF